MSENGKAEVGQGEKSATDVSKKVAPKKQKSKAEQSLEQFLQHQQREMIGECQRLKGVCKDTQNVVKPLDSLGQAFRRTLLFGAGKQTKAKSSTEKLVNNLMSSLITFGLPAYLAQIGREDSSLSEQEETQLKTFLAEVCGDEQKLNLKNLFSSSGNSSSSSSKKRPVYLEICSGAGEWVESQAESNKEVDYLACELRSDRLHQIFSRMVYGMRRNELKNLAILGGDASTIIPRHVPAKEVDKVFINFPEPPAWHGKSAAQNERHLLTETFFKDVKQVLKPGGMLTIWTDNLPYLRTLAQTVVTAGFQEADLTGAKALNKLPVKDDDVLSHYFGKPPVETGHGTVAASSYFHRLWISGNKAKRYYLCVTRPTSSSGVLVAGDVDMDGSDSEGEVENAHASAYFSDEE